MIALTNKHLLISSSSEGHIATHVYDVPQVLSKEYTERANLDSWMKGNLTEPGNILVVVGIGGMGKTQLVLIYAESNKHRYQTTLWIDARSKEAIISSFYRCARALGIKPEHPEDWETLRLRDHPIVNSVLQWLHKRDARYGEELLIFDNVVDLSTEVMTIIPAELHGSIILTTRDTQLFAGLPKRSRRLHVETWLPWKHKPSCYATWA